MMRSLWTRRPSRLDAEAGFTLSEVLIVSLILTTVLGLVYGALVSFTNQTLTTETQSRTVEDMRAAIEVITRDLRAANPINAIAGTLPLTTYDTNVSFDVYCSPANAAGCSASNLRPISYRVVNNRLERTRGGAMNVVLGPKGPAHRPLIEQRGAIVNNPTTQPVFRYFTRSGARIPTSGTGAPPSSTRFRNCARSVEIFLVVRAADIGDRTVNIRTRADLRNWNEEPGC